MGIHFKPTDKQCPCCKKPMSEVSIKNPFIDDWHYECRNWDCTLAGVKQ